MQSVNYGKESHEPKFRRKTLFWEIFQGEMAILSRNLNLNDLESGQKSYLMGDSDRRNLGSKVFNGIENDSGPMDLVLFEENDPLVSLEGKKRQQLVGALINESGNNVVDGSFVLTANYAGQSSRSQ